MYNFIFNRYRWMFHGRSVWASGAVQEHSRLLHLHLWVWQRAQEDLIRDVLWGWANECFSLKYTKLIFFKCLITIFVMILIPLLSNDALLLNTALCVSSLPDGWQTSTSVRSSRECVTRLASTWLVATGVTVAEASGSSVRVDVSVSKSREQLSCW